MSGFGGVGWISKIGAVVQEGDGMDQTRCDSPEGFHDFAKALVKKLIWHHHFEWDEHRYEDAVQELLLAGWQRQAASAKATAF